MSKLGLGIGLSVLNNVIIPATSYKVWSFTVLSTVTLLSSFSVTTTSGDIIIDWGDTTQTAIASDGLASHNY